MTRHLLFVIAIVCTGMLLGAPSGLATPLQCEDRNVNCLGGCADRAGGAGDLGGRQNKCLVYCSRQVSRCLIRDAMIRR